MSNSISFDRAADYYDSTRGLPSEQMLQFAALIARTASWDESSRLLEIGIGTGRIALPLAAHVGSVSGVDLSRQMMDHLVAKRDGEAVYPAQADATRLPFAASTFNGVVATHIFHLIPDWQAAVAEARRVLVPGGRLVTAWSRITLYRLWDGLKVTANARHVGINDKGQLRSYLLDSGWQPVDAVEEPYQQPIHLGDFAARVTRRQHSWTWGVDDETLARAEADLRAALRERFGPLDQTVPVDAAYGVEVFARPA